MKDNKDIKYVPMKSETIAGRKVDFYQMKIRNKKGEFVNDIVVVNVQGLKSSGDARFYTGGNSKKQLMNRLEMMIPQAIRQREEDRVFKESVKKYKFPTKKIFYYNTIKVSPKKYGGAYVTAEVFEHTPSGMDFIGRTKWDTASYKGEDSEVLDFLKEQGKIPQGMFPRGYYSWNKAEEYNVKITNL